jgi:ABC-type phosphate transport system substrate-binding protein
MTIEKTIGSRAEVWHGTAKHTSGGLTKNHLFKNKSGRIVSKKKHFSAKKDNRLVKSGYGTKKGKFGYVKIGTRKSKRGGAPHGNALSPAGIDGQGVTDYGHNSTDVQFAAGMAGGKRCKRGGSKGYGWLSGSAVESASSFKGGKRCKRGGTTKPVNASQLSNANPLARALNIA